MGLLLWSYLAHNTIFRNLRTPIRILYLFTCINNSRSSPFTDPDFDSIFASGMLLPSVLMLLERKETN